MKGLIQTSLIILILIIVGIVTSIFITVKLGEGLAVARVNGYEEGHAQGYEDGFQEGSRVGYQEGSKIGYAEGKAEDYEGGNETGFYFMYNPTYDEIREILAGSEKSSAKEIHDYAEANGIRVAYVRCQIARKAAEGRVYVYHLVAFETVDRGLIVVEPWSCREVKVEVGQRYSELNNFPLRAHDDTITKITIVW